MGNKICFGDAHHLCTDEHDAQCTLQDEPNKQGLAEALANIIELRKAGGNLQLIVITHDDNFVRDLGRAMNLGSSKTQLGTYYKVSREAVEGRPGIFHSHISPADFGA
jgi:hypothetical protein